MTNLMDYLTWRGDLPFSDQVPFCTVDSLIFARVSYFRFDRIGFSGSSLFSQVLTSLSELPAGEFFNDSDPLLVQKLLQSPRFAGLTVSDYRAVRDPEKAEQFAAIAVHLPDNVICVSFIGTDNTVYGLREDFNMGFMPDVPSQREGLRYTLEILRKYPQAKLRLTGHSKGGNVALYCALNLPEKDRERLLGADNFDGPGFDESLISFSLPQSVLPKLTTFLPRDSIVGRLLTHREKTQIANSCENGISQHDLYSWEILGGDLTFADSFETSSDMLHAALSDFLHKCPAQERRSFFDTVFDVLSSGADSLGNLSKNWYKNLPELFSSYREIPDENRKASFSFLSSLEKSYLSVLKKETVQHIEKTKDSLLEAFGRKNEEN